MVKLKIGLIVIVLLLSGCLGLLDEDTQNNLNPIESEEDTELSENEFLPGFETPEEAVQSHVENLKKLESYSGGGSSVNINGSVVNESLYSFRVSENKSYVVISNENDQSTEFYDDGDSVYMRGVNPSNESIVNEIDDYPRVYNGPIHQHVNLFNSSLDYTIEFEESTTLNGVNVNVYEGTFESEEVPANFVIMYNPNHNIMVSQRLVLFPSTTERHSETTYEVNNINNATIEEPDWLP